MKICNKLLFSLLLACLLPGACQPEQPQGQEPPPPAGVVVQPTANPAVAPGPRVIHIYVALCDNEHQGIVPVPASLGNGRDLKGNLYWGAGYGVKTFFRRSKQWESYANLPEPRPHVLERSVFRHVSGEYILVADAYDGAYLRQTIEDLLAASAGQGADSVAVDDQWLSVGGAASMLGYVGHNGLMDFSVKKPRPVPGAPEKELILLACYSKPYFAELIYGTNSHPLIWTTHLMAPEAYTLDAAIEGWIAGESPVQIQQRAAAAYHQYQHCGLKAASRLLVTGW